MTLSQSSGGYSATGRVSPAMPALLISTSSPPSAATASGTMRSISARLAMSQRRAVRPGISLAIAASALSSISQTKTLAPFAAKARANSRPMPAAPAVIKTRCDMTSESIRSYCRQPDNGPRPLHRQRVHPSKARDRLRLSRSDSGIPILRTGAAWPRAVCIEVGACSCELRCSAVRWPHHRRSSTTWRRSETQQPRNGHSQARQHAGDAGNPDQTINTLVILVVIVIVLGGLYLYAQKTRSRRRCCKASYRR